MRRIQFFLALSVLLVFVGNSFALQGRGQARGGAPTNIGPARNPNHDDIGTRNPGAGNNNSGGKSGEDNSRKSANALDTGGFKNHGQYMAAQNASEHLGIPLDQLKAKMTGAHAESLGKAIQDLTGLSADEANAEAKKAEQAAKNTKK